MQKPCIYVFSVLLFYKDFIGKRCVFSLQIKKTALQVSRTAKKCNITTHYNSLQLITTHYKTYNSLNNNFLSVISCNYLLIQQIIVIFVLH